MRQIVLDTETTGLEINLGHRIIEIGCVELVDRRETGNHWHHYFNPEREIDAGAYEVHGIGNEFLRDKPRFAELAEEFYDYVRGAELIIHNAAFDIGFLIVVGQRGIEPGSRFPARRNPARIVRRTIRAQNGGCAERVRRGGRLRRRWRS